MDRGWIPFDPETDRYYTAAQRIAQFREQHGAEVVDGYDQPAELILNQPFHAKRVMGPLASFRVTPSAWVVTHQGNESFSWLTRKVPADLSVDQVIFILKVGCGYGSAMVHPSGEFQLEVNGRPALVFRESKYWTVFEGDTVQLGYDVRRTVFAPIGQSLVLDGTFKEERMASFGLMGLRVPTEWLTPGQPALLRVTSHSEYPSPTWFRVDEPYQPDPATGNLRNLDWQMAAAYAKYGRCWYEASSRSRVFFGEVHSHSEVDSDGSRSLDQNFSHARRVAGCDFHAQTDHDDAIMVGDKWDLRLDAVKRWHEEGKFVTIPAYEFTSFVYGHRNVYFRDPDDAPFFSCLRDGDWVHPRELYQHFAEAGCDVLVIPHHPIVCDHPFNWYTSDARFDRLVEIFSGWGCHEDGWWQNPLLGFGSDKYAQLSVIAALQHGLRLGFVCGSDSHDGYPGAAQGKWPLNWLNKHSPVGSGRTAVLSDELTRDNVWQALYDRRCYGTTGNRIVLDFSVNEAVMGSEITAGDDREITLEVHAPCPIEKVHILRNGELLAREWCDQTTEEFSFLDDGDPDSEDGTDFYHARVYCADGEMAWSSPIWVARK